MLHQHAPKLNFKTDIQASGESMPRGEFVTTTLDAIWRPQSPPSTLSPLDHAASMALRDDSALDELCDSPSSRQLVQYWG